MSDALILGIMTIVASCLATAGTYFLGMWINKRKVPAEIDESKSNAALNRGELIEKYQSIAGKQADDNIELSKENEELKKEKMELRHEVDLLKKDVEDLKQARIDDREEFRKALEQERERSDKALREEMDKSRKISDYNTRLTYQIRSWGISPVPYDVEAAKLEMKQDFIEGSDFQKVEL
jgi:hypothetical protein